MTPTASTRWTRTGNLGWAIDSRSYELATMVLRHLGLNRVSLYTNNPHKIAALAEARLDVVREPLLTITPQNTAYLNVKRNKLGTSSTSTGRYSLCRGMAPTSGIRCRHIDGRGHGRVDRIACET